MQYKYCFMQNFEDFACGRVIIHRTGFSNYPVRLMQEVFFRCKQYLRGFEKFNIYDPCCGGAYILTVLGYLNFNSISALIGSDVNPEAVQLSQKNLSLLTIEGLQERIEHLQRLYSLYQKQSHHDAINSASNLRKYINSNELQYHIFEHDILNKPVKAAFKADIVFSDVPYGNMVSWQSSKGEEINNLLENIKPILHSESIIAISSDKSQKITTDLKKLEKLLIGKRKIEILKLY